MYDNGYIMIHRKMLNWGWYDDPVVKVVFLHLLLTANYSKSVYHGIEIERGQAIFGLRKLPKILGFSIKQIRTALRKLQDTGEIEITSTSQFSIATILNFDKYQIKKDEKTAHEKAHEETEDFALNTDIFDSCDFEKGTLNGTRRAHEGHTKGTQRATSNKENKNNNINNIYIGSVDGCADSDDFNFVLDLFNQTCTNLSKVKTINENRACSISDAFQSGIDFDRLFKKVSASSFLNGGGQRGWKASFDWIIKPENITKILNGDYDDNLKRQPGRAVQSVNNPDKCSFDIEYYENHSSFDEIGV